MKTLKYKTIEFSEVTLQELSSDLRIDADFYQPKYLRALLAVDATRSEHLGTLHAEIIHPTEIKRTYSDEGIQILLAQNIRDNVLDFKNSVFMPETSRKTLSRNKLVANDVVMTRSGANYGQTSYYLDDPQELFACADCLVIRTNRLNGLYLSTYLNCSYGKLLVDRGSYGMAQPHIAPSYLYKLAVPMPSPSFQKKLEKLIKQSFKQKLLAEKQYKDAENLLMAELGLLDWKPDTVRFTLGGREFEVEDSISRISSAEVFNAERMDAEHFQEKYYSARHTLVKAGAIRFTPLKELLINLTNGHTPLRHDLSVGEVPFLCAEHVADYEVTFESEKRILFKHHEKELGRTSLKNGDVLLTIKGRVGNAALVEDIPGPVNINQDVALLRLKETLPTWYVLAFLNSPLGKLFSQQLSTGGINPFLGLGNVRLLEIPVFSKEIMVRIAGGTQANVHAAGIARTKSRQLLEKAKRAVEVFIEEGEKAALSMLS